MNQCGWCLATADPGRSTDHRDGCPIGEARAVRGALGDLIDALHDEMRFEVGSNEHVLNHVEIACRLLAGPYMGYVGSWL